MEEAREGGVTFTSGSVAGAPVGPGFDQALPFGPGSPSLSWPGRFLKNTLTYRALWLFVLFLSFFVCKFVFFF